MSDLPDLLPDLLSETLQLLEWPRLCEHLSTFAATKIGSIACRQVDPWMSRPATDRLLDQTDEGIRLEQNLPGGLSLQGIHDLLPALKRAERGGILLGRELEQVASTLGSARKLRRTIDDAREVPALQDLISTIRTYPELEQEIANCLEPGGTIRDTASEKLAHFRQTMRERRSQIQDKLQRLLSLHSNAIQESVITMREGRYVLPLKATHRDVIRGLVHDSSSSGATLYVEPYSVVEANNQLKQAQARALAEEERILQALSAQVGSVAPDLEHLQSVIVQLDLALAKGRYSLWLQGHRPQFRPQGWSLRQVRHPLLLWQTRHEQEQTVIPVDLTLRPGIRVVVITGPNTGGKTVALKTLGLMVLMAKAGIYLPAREPAELPWFDGVFADIGDEQSLQQSLSTFSGHIRRISRILDTLTPSSLVLLDEVGAGTDPTEGAALARALLQHLAAEAALTMATTHYGELKALKYQQPEFENASVEFDEVSLAPTYRLLWGIPGRSNALTIARRLQLDPRVVDRAQVELQGEVSEVDVVIVGLEKQRAELETKTHQVESLHRELETLQQQMQQRFTQLTLREAQLQQEKMQAVQTTIQSARGEVAAVIRRLQQGDPNAQAAQQATAALDQLATRYSPKPDPSPPVDTEFVPEVGDRVRLQGLGHIGEVIAISGDDYVVRSGILKFNVGLSQLAAIDEVHARQRQRPKFVPPPPPDPSPIQIRTSFNTLDLRGKNVAEATDEIEEKLIAFQPGSLWIIHGHGTGKLRNGVQQYLKNHPRVAGVEAAAQADGGSGVTVAQIR